MKRALRIGELSELADCPVETIRFYERDGLLPKPPRTAANYRLYENRHLERLMFIRHCRYLDMTLAEIRRLLQFSDAPRASCPEVNTLLDEHITHVAERIVELQALRQRLKKLRRSCRASRAKDCGILQGIASAAGRAPANRRHRSHIDGTHD